MRKNIVEPDRPRMTIWRMRMAYWIPKATNTHTLRICNTYCFSTATMVARRRPNVTLYVHCLSCLSSPRSLAFYSCPLSFFFFSSICSYVIYRGRPILKLLVYFLFQTFACYHVGIAESTESQAFAYRTSREFVLCFQNISGRANSRTWGTTNLAYLSNKGNWIQGNFCCILYIWRLALFRH